MLATKIKHWTYDDYLKLDDDKRYEIINGELIEMAAPIFNHQRISRKLEFALQKYIEERNLGEMVHAPLDVTFAEDQVVQPDIIFISNEKSYIIKERGVFGAPDLVMEIISLSTEQNDRKDKFLLFEKYGVNEYWIVDPYCETIEVFTLDDNHYVSFCFVAQEGMEGIARSKVIDGFAVDITEIF